MRISYVRPEAACGDPLALLDDGARVVVDAQRCTPDVLLDHKTLDRCRGVGL